MKTPKISVDQIESALLDTQRRLAGQPGRTVLPKFTVGKARKWAQYTAALLWHYRLLAQKYTKLLEQNKELREMVEQSDILRGARKR